MGWERRGNKFYFYKKSRSGDKVTSTYHGRNKKTLEIQAYEFYAQYRPIKALRKWESLQEKKSLKAEKQKADEKFKQEIQEYKQACNAVNEAVEAMNSLVKAVLLISGFHQYKGQWRLRRKAKATTKEGESNVINTK